LGLPVRSTEAPASQHDREILRSLAGRWRVIADSPGNAEKRRLWRKHNALRSERPMILAYPDGGWRDVLWLEHCQCEDKELRNWEWLIRTKLYTIEVIRDDQTVEPWFDIHWRFNASDYSVELQRQQGDNTGSDGWDLPITKLDR